LCYGTLKWKFTTGVIGQVNSSPAIAADGTIYFVPNGDIRLLANTSRGWARAVVDRGLSGCGPELGGGAGHLPRHR